MVRRVLGVRTLLSMSKVSEIVHFIAGIMTDFAWRVLTPG